MFGSRLLIAALIVFVAPLAAHAAVFHVDVLGDAPDFHPGDGICAADVFGEAHGCTLRAAIMEANALGGPERHIIHLGPGLHSVSLYDPGTLQPGLFEDDLQHRANDGATRHDGYNDLDIGVDLEILGAGAGLTIVEGFRRDRVFHVLNPHAGAFAGPRYVKFANLTIRNGGTLQNGGGVLLDRVGTAVFEDVTVEDNHGAFNRRGDDGRLFSSIGGGLFSQASELVVIRSTISGNIASVGGGIAIASGLATIIDSTIEDNEAVSSFTSIVGGVTGLGGGLAVLEAEGPRVSTRLSLSGSTVARNRAIYGGGLGAWGSVAIENSTFSGNTSSQDGGGAYLKTPVSWARSELQFTTFTGNTALRGGGIFRDFSGSNTIAISRTIVAGNAPANCAMNTVVMPRILSHGFNLEDGDTCGFTDSTDRTNADPQLGPLRNNGGQTDTHAVPMFSPAVDAAGVSSIRVDQRGDPRPAGRAMDIGAFEFSMPRFITYPVPDGYMRLYGFSIRIEIRGTSGATFGEIVPAMSGMKLSVQIDQGGTAATVSAFNLDIDVNALRTLTGQKQPALFYVTADSGKNGSAMLEIAYPRFDGILKGVTTVPIGKK